MNIEGGFHIADSSNFEVHVLFLHNSTLKMKQSHIQGPQSM